MKLNITYSGEFTIENKRVMPAIFVPYEVFYEAFTGKTGEEKCWIFMANCAIFNTFHQHYFHAKTPLT